MSQPLRGAIVGFGHVAARGHMPFWQATPDVRIVAAVDSDPARRALFCKVVPDGSTYASLGDLLAADSLDFVDICTAPDSHAMLVEQALAGGCHVLCEKPLTIAADRTLRLRDCAATAGRVVHTVHNWLEAPVSRAVTALIADGIIGDVRSVEWATHRTQPAVAVGGDGVANWRLDPQVAGGGILLDHGWHALYCVGAWAGGVPKAVTATLENRRYRELAVEDTATLAVTYDTGATATVFLSWASDTRGNGIVVTGTDGRIVVDGATVTLTRGDQVEELAYPPSLAEGSHHPDWFARLGGKFLSSIGGSGESNLVEAVRCSLLIDAAQRSSAEAGRRVAVCC